MRKSSNLVLSETVLTALQFIHNYRYLTVTQVATVLSLQPKTVSELLLRWQRHGLLSYFGNTGTYGYGKTPKVYYLTRTGHALLRDERAMTGEELGRYQPVKVNCRWSPKMKHRLATLDVMMALERAVQQHADYRLAATLLEYRTQKANAGVRCETTDFVAFPQTDESRIVPDAGFILENTVSGARKLFLIEVDLGTEPLVCESRTSQARSFRHKIEKYDRYLQGGAFRERYKAWGAFQNFVLLTVTTSDQRVANMRNALRVLPSRLHQFYRFSTLEAVCADFFHLNWRGRSPEDQIRYALIKTGV